MAKRVPGIGSEDLIELEEEADLRTREVVNALVGRIEIGRKHVSSVAIDGEVGCETMRTMEMVRHVVSGLWMDRNERVDRLEMDDEWGQRRKARNGAGDEIEVEIDEQSAGER